MPILLLPLVMTVSAQTAVIDAFPGCWTGPRRHTIELSPESASRLIYYRDDGSKAEPIRLEASESSKNQIQKLLDLELSKEENALLGNLDHSIGPARYHITVTLGDRTWKVVYPLNLATLTPELKKALKYDPATLAIIAKLEKIHAVVKEISPKEAK